MKSPIQAVFIHPRYDCCSNRTAALTRQRDRHDSRATIVRLSDSMTDRISSGRVVAAPYPMPPLEMPQTQPDGRDQSIA